MTSREERAVGRAFLMLLIYAFLWFWPLAVGSWLAQGWHLATTAGFVIGWVLETPWLIYMIWLQVKKQGRRPR